MPASASACSSRPRKRQIEAALRLRAPVVELHTGEYAHLCSMAKRRVSPSSRIADAAALAARTGSSRTPATA
jgi:pyridoxine 5-phosphate synthase